MARTSIDRRIANSPHEEPARLGGRRWLDAALLLAYDLSTRASRSCSESDRWPTLQLFECGEP